VVHQVLQDFYRPDGTEAIANERFEMALIRHPVALEILMKALTVAFRPTDCERPDNRL
jgi:hypothetical protein